MSNTQLQQTLTEVIANNFTDDLRDQVKQELQELNVTPEETAALLSAYEGGTVSVNLNFTDGTAETKDYVVMFSFPTSATLTVTRPAGLTPAQVVASVTDSDVDNAEEHGDKDDLPCGWSTAVTSGRYDVDVA